MTKAEEKRILTEKRHAFITEAATVVAKHAIPMLGLSRQNNKIIVSAKSWNRYFDLLRYGEQLMVRVYQSGDVDVTLKELSHSDVTIRLINYEEAALAPAEVIKRFEDDIICLLEDYIAGYWHILMDYMSRMNYVEGGSVDWRTLEKQYRDDMNTPRE